MFTITANITNKYYISGVDRIKADFEFMVGHILSRIWLLLWWIIPLFLTTIFAWAMITLPLEGLYKEDPSWLYGIGWAVVLCSIFIIFFIGCCVISRQDGYTFKDVSRFSIHIMTDVYCWN